MQFQKVRFEGRLTVIGVPHNLALLF